MKRERWGCGWCRSFWGQENKGECTVALIVAGRSGYTFCLISCTRRSATIGIFSRQFQRRNLTRLTIDRTVSSGWIDFSRLFYMRFPLRFPSLHALYIYIYISNIYHIYIIYIYIVYWFDIIMLSLSVIFGCHWWWSSDSPMRLVDVIKLRTTMT